MTILPALDQHLPDIRMRLHLERLRPGGAKTSRRRLSDRAELGRLVSAYRQAGSRVETSLANPFSKPMLVEDVARELDKFDSGNRAAFLEYVRALSHNKPQSAWVLPVYDLGADGMFLMDGNHRAVATYLHGQPFEIELLVLHAPLDRRILFPLKYWDGGLLRFWNRLQRNYLARV